MKLFFCVLSLVASLAHAEDSIEYRLRASQVQIETGNVENAEVISRAPNYSTKGAYWPVPAHNFVVVKQPVRVILTSDNGESEIVISRHLAGETKLPFSTNEPSAPTIQQHTPAATRALVSKRDANLSALRDPRAKVSVVVTSTSVAISEIKLPK